MFRGFSSGRGNFETPPHIDTWTNEKTVNGDKDVSIGGMFSTGSSDVKYYKMKIARQLLMSLYLRSGVTESRDFD